MWAIWSRSLAKAGSSSQELQDPGAKRRGLLRLETFRFGCEPACLRLFPGGVPR